jgi:uncharacterized membrane protein
MKKIKQFLLNTIVGGVFVILPITVMVILFKWILNMMLTYLKPLTQILTVTNQMNQILAYALALLLILLVCFIIGAVVRTTVGKIVYRLIENKLLMKIPGYSLIKETLEQLLGKTKSPFSTVALVKIFNNDTMVTGFVTNEHKSGLITVFVPTGPNPTSGNIYHLDAKYVNKIDVSVEKVMRSIIGCGTGSDTLLDSYLKKGKKKKAKK